MKFALIILYSLFFVLYSVGQTQHDTLVAVVDQQLIKVNKNTGNIANFVPVTGIPAGSTANKMTWCEPNQCFYTLAQAYPPTLAKIDLSGNYTTLGTLSISPGNLYMCETVAYNRFDGELYVSGSLNGNPNSNPPDYHSEALLRVDTTTLQTTFIGNFTTPTSAASEADALAFGDNGMMYFYDGQPGQFNRFYMQDISFTSASILMLNSGYNPPRDLTVKGDDLFFSLDRVLTKINIPTLALSSVGTMFTAADFNGQYITGLTWLVNCPSQDLFGSDTTLCAGQSLILNPSVVGTSYLWQDGSTNASFDASNGGTFWVDVTNGGCSYTDTIVVNVEPIPFVDLGNDTTLCDGASLILDASSSVGTYVWQDGSTASTFTAVNSGNYWVQVTNNGCSYTDDITISTANSSGFNFGNDTTLCFGETLTLDLSSTPGNFLWQDSSTGTSFTVTNAGLYWLSISNLCGTSTDSIIVDYAPDFSFDLGNDTTICIGNTVELTCSVSGSSVVWQDGSTGTSYIASNAGEYFAQASLNGCLASDTIQINTLVSPEVDLGNDIILCEGTDAIVAVQNQNGSVQWNTGSTESSIIVSAAGIYIVEVINQCGTESDTVAVQVEDCYCGFYVPNSFTPNDDEFNSRFGPVFDCTISQYKLEIFNRWGEIIFESQDPNYMWDGTYLGRPVQDGTYTYKINYSTEYLIVETIVGHLNVIR